MAYLLNDPAVFAREALAGFVAANADTVVAVDGGVAVRTPASGRRVALITGGGSGHYPAFAGLVGAGLADAAVAGNVFASPSSDAVASVARAAARPDGVLFCFGNYSGDVMQFRGGARALEAEGVANATVLVTDDVASAPPERRAERRGIAGDLFVLKVLGAAADTGLSLEELTDIGMRANAATFTVGVAFGGCTLPGADAPLFTIADGSMALGLGIHGEPGLEEGKRLSADELAVVLTDRILAERPSDAGGRVAVIVNGLGSVKSEELFVLYHPVAARLSEAGLTVVGPEVGEFVTSFEMAGVSLTVSWLDDELEALWLAAADAPGYRRRRREADTEDAPEVDHTATAATVVTADADSQRCAATVVVLLAAIAQRLGEEADMLGQLDAVAGDGDHGIGMRTGSAAAWLSARQLQGEGAGAGSVLSAAGAGWNRNAGGTSGGLWGALLSALGAAIGDTGSPTADVVVTGIERGLQEIVALGNAKVGDKTLVDALVPFSETLRAGVSRGDGLVPAWAQAADAAQLAARDTAELSARTGRASKHGAASHGSPDPGAVSLGIVAGVVAAELPKSDGG
jgi:D-erythrulose 4-kinase